MWRRKACLSAAWHLGMGAYHGQAGFETFSHLKPVFVQSRINSMGLLAPPYGKVFERIVGGVAAALIFKEIFGIESNETACRGRLKTFRRP